MEKLNMSNARPFNVLRNIKEDHVLEFEMVIDDFDSIRVEEIKYPIFHFENCNIKWQFFVRIYDRRLVQSTDDLNVGVRRVDSGANHVVASLFLEYKNSDKIVFYKNSFMDTFTLLDSARHLSIKKLSVNDTRDIVVNDGISQILFGTQLRIFGHFTVTRCCKICVVSKNQHFNNTKRLQFDFKSLLSSEEFTDVNLKMEEGILRAHKFVLCARSPVLKKMFESDMKESKQNCVEIKDVKKSIFEAFINFLYTGVMAECDFTTLIDIYRVADKYEVKTLQDSCRELLVEQVTEETVSIILNMSDLHNDETLKEICEDFICKNFAAVEETGMGHVI